MKDELMRLRSLMFDFEQIDEFAAMYIKVIEDIGNQKINRVDFLLVGHYTQQLRAARVLLVEQIEWLRSQSVEGSA
jgi:hypothetical protein